MAADQAGVRYRTDFLKKLDERLDPPGAGDKIEPPAPAPVPPAPAPAPVAPAPVAPVVDWSAKVPAYSPKSMLKMYDQVDIHIPSMERSGIYANKAGFHNSRRNHIAQGRTGDYSIIQTLDKQGDDDAAAGIDMKFSSRDMLVVSKRMMEAKPTHGLRTRSMSGTARSMGSRSRATTSSGNGSPPATPHTSGTCTRRSGGPMPTT